MEFFNGLVDHHSHILPCVDDGIQSLEESLKVLAWYEELGVERVVFTPHIMDDYPRNTPDNLRAEFAKFKANYSGRVELSLAAEYMLDLRFEREVQRGDMLTLSHDHLLVECSYVEAPINFHQSLHSLMQRGYFVVMAHAERYLFLSMSDYRRLREMGVKFQLNILSVLGTYGKEVAQRARALLDLSYYDIVGLDLHNLEVCRRYLTNVKLKRRVIRQIEAIKGSNLCF